MRAWLLALMLASSGATLAEGAPITLGAVTVFHVWARATPMSAKTGVIYLTLTNAGAVSDELVGVSTPVAESAQVHSSMNDGGVMKMSEVTNLDLPPGASIVLQPSAMHLMLVNLTRRLTEGDKFPLVLTFQHAGNIEVEVLVGKVGAMTDPGGGG